MEIKFEFGKERKIGEIVQDFVNLVRIVFGHFFRTMLQLSVIPLCLLLVLIYYGTTKINLTTGQSLFEDKGLVVVTVITVFFLMVVSFVFYGLAIEYFLLLKRKRNTDFGTNDVWSAFRLHIGKYAVFFVVFLVSSAIIAIPLLLVLALVMFIPFLGNFVFGVIMAAVGVWYFCAFAFYREGYMDAFNSMQQTFKIIKKKLFDYSVSSYIISFIFQVMLGMLLLVPALVFGVMAYNFIGFNESFFESFYGRLLSSIGLTLLMLLYILYFMITVLVSGIIYESAKEVAYGENVYQTIAKIGKVRDV